MKRNSLTALLTSLLLPLCGTANAQGPVAGRTVPGPGRLRSLRAGHCDQLRWFHLCDPGQWNHAARPAKCVKTVHCTTGRGHPVPACPGNRATYSSTAGH